MAENIYYNLNKRFAKFVIQNICGMLGVSLYILADTFFISKAAGADGITVLNLALPIYNFMFAFGSMLGLGGATKFAILREQMDEEADGYFSVAVASGVLIGLVFTLFGAISPQTIIRLMGGRGELVTFGVRYFRWMLLFGPAFVLNYIFSAFVRNDNDPARAMIATLSSSAFNIVFDYVFMFPLEMGLSGAALATAISPLLAIAINSTHFFKKENNLKLLCKGTSNKCKSKILSYPNEVCEQAYNEDKKKKVEDTSYLTCKKLKHVNKKGYVENTKQKMEDKSYLLCEKLKPLTRRFLVSCQLGVTGFMGEMTLGITNTIFNYLILGITGNIGVAAYGVVANFSLVVMSVFNGLAQGAQPVLSECYGREDKDSLKRLLKLGITAAIVIACVVYGTIFIFTDKLVSVFNSEGNTLLAEYAHEGMRLYFLGYLIAGINIFCAGFYGATNRPGRATFVSLMRGFVAIAISSIVLAKLFGMTGVWLAFLVAELITIISNRMMKNV